MCKIEAKSRSESALAIKPSRTVNLNRIGDTRRLEKARSIDAFFASHNERQSRVGSASKLVFK